MVGSTYGSLGFSPALHLWRQIFTSTVHNLWDPVRLRVQFLHLTRSVQCWCPLMLKAFKANFLKVIVGLWVNILHVYVDDTWHIRTWFYIGGGQDFPSAPWPLCGANMGVRNFWYYLINIYNEIWKHYSSYIIYHYSLYIKRWTRFPSRPLTTLWSKHGATKSKHSTTTPQFDTTLTNRKQSTW